MKLIIDRELHASDDSINLGRIYDPATDFELCTLENPWLDNERYISCIPKGTYTCKRVDSPKYNDTFEVMDVEGRDHILFHHGNWERNTMGCILLGLFTNKIDMVMSSRKARAKFMKYTRDVDEFELEIK